MFCLVFSIYSLMLLFKIEFGRRLYIYLPGHLGDIYTTHEAVST